MSRLTGSDAFGLMEAYQSIYAPQELTEEQVWEEVEIWVNSLVEEGYDLSGYTWEDMYEAYLSEGAMGGTTPASSARPASGGVSNIPSGVKKSPNTLQNLGAAQYSAYKGGGGDAAMAQGKGTTAQIIAQGRKNISRFDGGPRQGNPNIVGSPVVGPRPPAPTPTQRPAAPAPTRSAAPAQGTQRPAPSGIVKTTNTLAASPTTGTPPTPTQATTPRQSISQDVADLRAMRKASQQRIIAQGGTPVTPLVQSFDPFDIVKGYLIDEGYADTNEAALAIMANMSEEWKQSILDEGDNYDKNRRRAAQRAAARNEARRRGQTGNVPGVGYVSPRPEGETYRDSAGVERHTSGARMPRNEG